MKYFVPLFGCLKTHRLKIIPAIIILLVLSPGCGGGTNNSLFPSTPVNTTPSNTEQYPDTNPPSPPSNVSAIKDDCDINLTWTNPAIDFSGTVVVKATDTLSISSINPYTMSPLCNGALTSCADSGLNEGAQYFYAVAAYDEAGNFSAPVIIPVVCSIAPPPDLTPPSAPTGISASQNDCNISVTWSNPADEDFSGVMVRRGDTNYPYDPLASDTASNTIACSGLISNCDDSDLVDAQTYYYSVFAYDTSQNYSSPASVSIACEYIPPLPNPAPPSALAAVEDDCEISLSWSNPADADYSETIVRRSADAYPSDPATNSTKLDTIVCQGNITACDETDLDDGTTYYYSVFAKDTGDYYSTAATTSVVCNYTSFRIIAIPDSQYMSLDYPALFTTVTTWIANNRDTRKIAFVVHEGDLVHTRTESEWTNAETSMSVLDGVVPYAVAVGNHDYSGDRDTTDFNTHFPFSKYSAFDYFGGVFEADKMDNAYYYFTAEGTDWLVISMEYNPRDEVIAWANQVATDNPDRRIIVDTHAYLGIDNTRTSVGENIWNNFVKLHANITFVANGHYLGGNGGRLVSEGDNGNNVYQMFANYQDLPFGGIGYVRTIKINPSTNKVTVRTYSPFLNAYKIDDDNDFVFTGVELGPP